MFWRIVSESCEAGAELERSDGRFALYRHWDSKGPHLDLRIEQQDFLLGLRLCGETIEGETWAVEKAPHPPSWLEREGKAVRLDAGDFAWVEHGKDECVLLLKGKGPARRLRVARAFTLPVEAVRATREALEACGATMDTAATLIRDGATARRRAVERFCGLGRELDGEAFEEGVWRKALESLSLEEIHGQLRAFEVRFDRKYPPTPVSRPERLEEVENSNRAGAALAIINQ